MSVTLLKVADITDDVLRIKKNNASLNFIEGYLAESRTYDIKDADGEIDFMGAGLLARNPSHNAPVDEASESGQPLFAGANKRASQIKGDDGFIARLEAKSAIATLIGWAVDSNDATTHAGFLVNGAHAKGVTTIAVKTGTTIVPIPAQISFTDSLVPRYNVLDQTDNGSETTSIELNQPLQEALLDNDEIRISIPEIKSGAEEIFDTFQALSAVAAVTFSLGSSFQTLDAEDVNAGHLLWVHVLAQKNISLGDHLARIMEMANLNLTISESGVIDIYRSGAYKGNAIFDQITQSEILNPYAFSEDVSRLVIGYDCLYHVGENVLRNAPGDVDASLIGRYGGVKRWVPVKLKGESANIFEYSVVYADSVSADHFGQTRIDYYGHTRRKFKCGLKQSLSRRPNIRITLQLGKEFSLFVPSSRNQLRVNEPCRCISFAFDEDNFMYTNAEFELTNSPFPNLKVDKTIPTKPVAIAA